MQFTSHTSQTLKFIKPTSQFRNIRVTINRDDEICLFMNEILRNASQVVSGCQTQQV